MTPKNTDIPICVVGIGSLVKNSFNSYGVFRFDSGIEDKKQVVYIYDFSIQAPICVAKNLISLHAIFLDYCMKNNFTPFVGSDFLQYFLDEWPDVTPTKKVLIPA